MQPRAPDPWLRRTRLIVHACCSILVVGCALLVLVAFDGLPRLRAQRTAPCSAHQREARIALKCVQRNALAVAERLGRTPRAREVRCDYLPLARNYDVFLASHPTFFVVTALGKPDSRVFGDIWSLDDRAELAHIHDVCD